MKEKRVRNVFLLLCAMAVMFCVGFFVGRANGRHTVVITTSPKAENELLTLQPAQADTTPDVRVLPSREEDDSKVNINTASANELAALPGIGDILAERIIAYRVKHGAFGFIEEIMNVNGIGETKFDAIKDKITV